MFIRRNMSSNVSYQQLKQYECFKDLAKYNDVLVLKEILPMVVKKVSLDAAKQAFNPKKMMYIPEENNDGVQTGQAIDATVKDIKDNAKIKFFMIQTKIYNILKYLFFKKIQCMEKLKNFQKLNFFYRCCLDQIPFGGYIYRKEDAIKSIFYLVRGKINISKCFDQKQINVCTIYEGSFFGIYEFQKNKIKRILNTQSCSNDTIVLTISLDLITQIFGKNQDEVLKRIISLPSETPKIKYEQTKKISIDRSQKNFNKFIKAYQFQRRLIKFSQTRNIDRSQSAFGKFIDNKSLLFKIKDSNDSSALNNNQILFITTNFHKNEESMKYYKRLNQHRLYKLGNRLSSTRNQKQNSFDVKGSDILTSRLKYKFNNSKKYFQKRQSTQKQTLEKTYNNF